MPANESIDEQLTKALDHNSIIENGIVFDRNQSIRTYNRNMFYNDSGNYFQDEWAAIIFPLVKNRPRSQLINRIDSNLP